MWTRSHVARTACWQGVDLARLWEQVKETLLLAATPGSIESAAMLPGTPNLLLCTGTAATDLVAAAAGP